MEDNSPIANQEAEQPSVPVHTGNICTFPLASSPDVPSGPFLDYYGLFAMLP